MLRIRNLWPLVLISGLTLVACGGLADQIQPDESVPANALSAAPSLTPVPVQPTVIQPTAVVAEAAAVPAATPTPLAPAPEPQQAVWGNACDPSDRSLVSILGPKRRSPAASTLDR